MPVFVPFIPPVQSQPEGPPAWLKLNQGEVYVRSYGAGTGGSKQRIVLVIALLMGLLVALQFGFLFYRMASRDAPIESASSSTPFIAIALVIAGIIAVGLVAVKFRLKLGALEAVLTNQRMQFRIGRDITGFGLSEIVRLVPGSDRRNRGIQVFIREHLKPAVTLPVENLEQATAELKAYAVAAGAKPR